MRLRLYLGEKHAEAVQFYETIGLVVGKMFGGKKTSGSPPPDQTHQTKDEIVAGMKRIFGKNG